MKSLQLSRKFLCVTADNISKSSQMNSLFLQAKKDFKKTVAMSVINSYKLRCY